MRKLLPTLIGLFVMLTATPALTQEKVIMMSTTTSTEASGLLGYLLPEFTKDTGITVRVMAKGTGASLRDGMDGNADVIFVHDVAREEKFVAEGYGTKRYYVMYNDFIIVGPANDPAGIGKAPDAAAALQRIAAAAAPFVSRGDDSGTHARERQLWQATGLPLTEARSPRDGDGWYFSIGQGMGEALIFAEEKNGYVLADRGTYLQYKFGRQQPYELEIVYEGDDMLKNPYGVIPVNPAKHPHVKFELADTFARWLVSERGQQVIGNYKLHGQLLFFPDAK
ncbi:substrate-binding domain-containing protein [Desulfurivibrio sp. C05AmB]|uniref:substrate-binding domain-containing protein n=1 Tax=Desulfurivibrio sp. C05AmB TaxID=3374371 RepID=UPI00376ED7EE